MALKEHVFQLEVEELNVRGGRGKRRTLESQGKAHCHPAQEGSYSRGKGAHPKALTSGGARRVHPGDSRTGSCSCRN